MKIEWETKNHFGTDHTYITAPAGLRELWRDIRGKETINQHDLELLHSLARFFGAGASSVRIEQ